MYLKSLDIRGFKSFAEATHIDFAPGLNLIVGPNGCGKSNLVDAIRWVLGEQNVRNLRGQKLEDVIFAGTDQKKALSLASVSLTLDNSDQVLPSPYTEVMVNRRVYRSEQSEFYLNQQPVRLKDINQLFNGTGVGRKGYAIIGQGEIENLLSARPHDIRLMLEEASGLIRYRYQKDEAIERLKANDRDLQRIQDIAGELESRLQDLKIKAEKAAAHLELSKERQSVHNVLLKSEWSVLKRDMEQVKENLASHQTALVTCSSEVEALEGEHNRLFADHHSLQVKLDQTKNQRYETINQLNQFSAQQINTQEKIAAADTRQAEIIKEKELLTVQVERLNTDLAAANCRLESITEAWSQEKLKLRHLENEWQQLVAGQQATLQEVERLKQEALDKAQNAALLRNRIQEITSDINQLTNRRRQYELEEEQRLGFIKSAKDQENRITEELANRETELEQIIIAAREREAQQITWQQQVDRQERQLIDYRRQLAEYKHELQTLENIIESYSGYSETVKVLIKRQHKIAEFLPGLLGVVGELIEVPAGLETALEIALGRGMENLIVKTEQDARQGIDFLKREKAGRATFLPLDVLKPEPLKTALVERLKKEPGVIGIASELVNYPPEANQAISYLLGRIVIIEDLDSGLRLLKTGSYNLRMVTREGEVLLPQGAITGGRRQHESAVLKRKARKQALAEEIKQLLIRESELKNTQTKSEAEGKRIREELAAQHQQLQAVQYQIKHLTDERLNLEKQHSNQYQRIEEIKWQQRLVEQQLAKLQQEIQLKQQQLENDGDLEQVTQKELARYKEQADDQLRKAEVGREKINTQATLAKAREQELVSTRAAQEQTLAMQESILASFQQQEEKLVTLASQKKQNQQVLYQLAKDIAAKEIEQQRLSNEEQELQEKLQEFNQQATALLTRLNNARFEMEKLNEKRRQLEVRLARQETEFAIFDQQLSAEEKTEPPVVLSDKKLRELRHQEAVLTNRLEALGSVDPGSVEEFKLTSERYALLSSQHQDLLKARNSILKLVKDSEQVMQGRFGEFLQQANDSFNQNFMEIFGGGEAALVLLDQEEDSGVELVVKMPGKKRQSLNMLSGGERALTCIALIFSLLRLKPVPFCLLDEIDAALDEINLQRFAKFISQMASGIQFIIISHRQGTIEIADTLYGVTMPQDGVSAVLSVSMQEREQLVG